jgi:hypothetical protein
MVQLDPEFAAELELGGPQGCGGSRRREWSSCSCW